MWTAKKPINGLRHFVLVNKIKEKNKIKNLMVSVVDIEINLEISNEELIHSGDWIEGWLNFSKDESITKDYLKYKSLNNSKRVFDKIFINKNSIFNIS